MSSVPSPASPNRLPVIVAAGVALALAVLGLWLFTSRGADRAAAGPAARQKLYTEKDVEQFLRLERLDWSHDRALQKK